MLSPWGSSARGAQGAKAPTQPPKRGTARCPRGRGCPRATSPPPHSPSAPIPAVLPLSPSSPRSPGPWHGTPCPLVSPPARCCPRGGCALPVPRSAAPSRVLSQRRSQLKANKPAPSLSAGRAPAHHKPTGERPKRRAKHGLGAGCWTPWGTVGFRAARGLQHPCLASPPCAWLKHWGSAGVEPSPLLYPCPPTMPRSPRGQPARWGGLSALVGAVFFGGSRVFPPHGRLPPAAAQELGCSGCV